MYEQFYGFTGRPFQLTPDPAFYFESATHQKAMSYLGYGLNQGEGFIVITGEVGAGKSTLVGLLMQRVDPAQLTVAHIVTSALDGQEIVHVVAQSFGIEIEGKDKASALGAIERFLQDEARAGRRCLLIVDECQSLDISALEELRMLSNFQLGSHPLLQSLLLGQPEFRAMVAKHPDLDQLRQRIIASHHLEPLDESELEDYVTHRLRHVGWDERPSFEDGLLNSLYEQTWGIPRRVNQVMNRLLLLSAIEESEAVTAEMLQAVIDEMSFETEHGSEAVPDPLPASSPEVTPTAHDTPVASLHQINMDAAEPAETQDVDSVPASEVADMLAQRDARTAELEAAIAELQAAKSAPILDVDLDEDSKAKVDEVLGRMEARLEEQEQSLRHVLTMLIEWLEDDNTREAA
ncbi:XrtA/PEP-CTERM system-associated ATPase [Erythrobacter sp. MTPC3]|uniref:XrtA/PEP-CTERM system-associated ATPase n=1 Tax=Erythrobacter sp. MTPC3 TaxID=3056564 RepID=UPI0036F4000C